MIEALIQNPFKAESPLESNEPIILGIMFAIWGFYKCLLYLWLIALLKLICPNVYTLGINIMIQHTKLCLEQCSDVWALLWSEYTFLWKHQFELFFHKILSKTYRFKFFDQMTQEKNGGKIWILAEFIFSFSAKIGFFGLKFNPILTAPLELH